MNKINSLRKAVAAFSRKARMTGFSETLKFSLKKITGRLKFEEEIETLYYILNRSVDITKFPPAEGALRKLQLCDTVLLSIFDSVCKKQNWTYWLCNGTLLGSVRHKGFIPWDDDIDVYMPRKDYNEIPKKCPEIFSAYGDDTIEMCDTPHFTSSKCGHCIGYKNLQTGIKLDIFPVDMLNVESEDEEESIRILTKRADKYQKFYYANVKKISYEALSEARNKILGTEAHSGRAMALHYPEFAFNYIVGKVYISPQSVIFPLRTEQFEGLSLNVPNDTHTYLTGIFGDYMQFPRSRLFCHDNVDILKNSGINMDQVLEKLKDIERFFRA